MKKIIAMILALTCIFALFSCGGNEAIDATVDCYANSAPTKVVTTTTRNLVDDFDEVIYTLGSEYVLVTGKVGDKIATVSKYWDEQLRTVSSGANAVVVGPIEKVEGSDEFLQGMGRRTNGGRWQADGLNFAPTKGSIAINITEDNVKDIKYTEQKYNNVLTFVVEYDKIGEVFGTNEDGEAIILSDSDIEVSITNNGAQITGITLSYTIDADGDFPAQNVVVATAYTYAAETPEFVKSIQ